MPSVVRAADQDNSALPDRAPVVASAEIYVRLILGGMRCVGAGASIPLAGMDLSACCSSAHCLIETAKSRPNHRISNGCSWRDRGKWRHIPKRGAT